MSSAQSSLIARRGRLAELRGANYLPSWARSSYESWGKAFSADQLDRELGYARRLGLNAVRVWLAWDDPEQVPDLVAKVRHVLDTAGRLELAVVLVLFDSCGCERRLDAPVVPVRTIPDRMGDDPRWARLEQWAGDRELIGPYELIDTPWVDDPMAAIWTSWRPMPDYATLAEPQAERDRQSYVAALLTAVADHPALVAAELVNEPFLSPAAQGKALEPVVDHYRQVLTVARRVAPSVPLGIGAADAADAAVHDANLGGGADFISLHCYGGAEELKAEVAAAHLLAAGRPVVLSEWGCFPGLPDERHEQVYRERTLALQDLDVGWFLFHLVAGYGPFALSALLYPNGTMRPAARFLKDHLGS